ncbi:recombination protein NinG [Riemerella anatipestifer]|uniref:recombination protein NinG n=1 Tax=Riemerella anatipestifer TaxID=34085 RepID=UPI00129E5248|nr:recombination protein NinG [Riemerella anatipestifer]MDR7782930.1 recombination protein NinG [Riemerella anatipestifer]MDY3345985.1 recombination protein NinG [Riemerella anatipestifer]MDY3348306.1 recombination protein NinG [Riemerella anatipestifer]MDY3389737.1 recombination protein NinG [Riemerella anatipestifer]MDY3517679.1 recombination protein NinG [Riemerella anatipestifer]
MIEAKTIQKYKTKTTTQLKQIAQRYFNAYIRHRDSDNGFFVCISCGKIKHVTKMHAGHYFSVGGYPSVRFDLDNVNGQCHKCNTFMHGNLIPYRENLIKKIGKKRFEQLEQLAKMSIKHDRIMLIELIERMKQQLKK